MKLICSKESFLKLLNIAENVISTKNNISILSNVLIEAKENKIKISACETKLNFFAEIGADIIEEGKVSVHCNKLYSITKKLPGEEIYLEKNNNNIIVIKPKENDNIKYSLKGIDADKFPPIKLMDEPEYFSIKKEILSDMIKKTIFAISQNENRRFVNGIFFEKDDHNIKMVATDGKRLSFIRKNIEIPNELEKGIIIPFKILIETLKLCTGEGDIQIAFNNKNISIKIDNITFFSNLLEGNFPPYEKVIPIDQTISVTVDRAKLYESLDRISQISDRESHKITLSISNNDMRIFTEDITIGSGEEIIPIEYDGENFNIFLNYMFITDFLNVINNQKVILEFKDQQSTVTVRELDNNEFIYIMMPMSS